MRPSMHNNLSDLRIIISSVYQENLSFFFFNRVFGDLYKDIVNTCYDRCVQHPAGQHLSGEVAIFPFGHLFFIVTLQDLIFFPGNDLYEELHIFIL